MDCCFSRAPGSVLNFVKDICEISCQNCWVHKKAWKLWSLTGKCSSWSVFQEERSKYWGGQGAERLRECDRTCQNRASPWTIPINDRLLRGNMSISPICSSHRLSWLSIQHGQGTSAKETLSRDHRKFKKNKHFPHCRPRVTSELGSETLWISPPRHTHPEPSASLPASQLAFSSGNKQTATALAEISPGLSDFALRADLPLP